MIDKCKTELNSISLELRCMDSKWAAEQISQLQTENESLRSERDRYKRVVDELHKGVLFHAHSGLTLFSKLQEKKDKQYDKEAGKVRHHPKCDFLYIEGAKCDCGAYKDE